MLKGHQEELLPLLQELKDLQFFGSDHLKHWSQNQITCKLDLINPDLVIQDKPIVPSPNMMEEYKKHITALLKLKVVFSGSDTDSSGKTIKKKSRLVFNYKRLNDNTYKDQYTLPSIDYLLLKIRNKEIYSKFDLKSTLVS